MSRGGEASKIICLSTLWKLSSGGSGWREVVGTEGVVKIGNVNGTGGNAGAGVAGV